MADSYYVPIGPDRYGSGSATEGPWAPGLQHGGPPNALVVHLAEQALRAATGRDDLVALRLASDFIGPVPVAELDVRTRVVRAARSAALVAVNVSGGGRDCLDARVWFVRATDTSAHATTSAAPPAIPDAAGTLGDFGYGRSLDWRFVRGGLRESGPGTVWVRPLTDLLPGVAPSGLARAVLVADSGNGVSSVLDWQAWSFVNVDLDVHLARPFEGEWVLLDAVTDIGAHGSALARSTLSDERGVVGGGMQTLVLGAIPTA